MGRVSTLIFVLVAFSSSARADPLDVYIGEIGMTPFSFQEASFLPPNGSPGGPVTFGESGSFQGIAVTLPDLSQGGSVPILNIGLGEMWPDIALEPVSTNPVSIDGTFNFIIGKAGALPQTWSGPQLDVSFNINGSITQAQGLAGELTGGFNGVADAVTVIGNAADLPSPLLDILHNPGHLHIGATALSPWDWGGDVFLGVTLTFDPPSPTPVPEPEAATTLLAAACWAACRRWRRSRT